MTTWISFADDPIDGAGGVPDLLERDQYARHLTALLDRVRHQTEGNSATLALIGPWGGGKSSVLNQVKTHLAGSDWKVAEFNPWAYNDLDSMVRGFFQEIRAALPPDVLKGRAREAVGDFVKTYAWLGKAASVAGADLGPAFEGFGDLIKGDSSLSAQHEKVAAALRDARQPVLVILDDLDRLAPAELLLVFKLVRFAGRLPFLYYVLSYDEQTLLDVITRTDLCSNDRRRARDYLEKIIQVRLDLPPLRHSQASRLFRQGIENVAAAHGVTLEAADDDRLGSAYEVHIGERLTTPRAVNRYVIQLDALYPLVAGEVDFADFAVLSFLRTYEPRLYAQLARMKSTLAADRGRAPTAPDDTDYAARWRAVVLDGEVSPPDADAVVGLLALLFPVVAGSLVKQPASAGDAMAGGGVPGDAVRDAARRRGVGHTDYFDRYFAFAGSVDSDLPDAEVRRLIQEMAAGHDMPPRVQRWLGDNTARAVRKLMALRVPTPQGDGALLRFLAHSFDSLSDEQVGYENQRRTIEQATAELLPQDAAAALAALARDNEASLLLVTRLAVSVRADAARPVVSEKVRLRLAAATSVPFWELPKDERNLLYVWQMLDPEAVRTFLRSAAWDLADVVNWVIAPAPGSTPGTLRYWWENAKRERLEEVLGIEHVLEVLGERIEAAKAKTLTDNADNPAARRRAALETLYIMRATGRLSGSA